MIDAADRGCDRRGKLLAPALKAGDTIGIVSPSWFGGDAFVPRARRGIAQLERLGFRVKVADHAFNNHGHVSDTAENRVADLHAMFADPEVAAILATIGGDHSCHLLPLIDWNLIQDNPKIFMGFSDSTVLNLAIWSQTGLVTFNGPSLLTDWAEYPEMPAFSSENALRAICRPEPMGDLAPSSWWTEEFLDWTNRRKRHPALAMETRVALTLRMVGGLTVPEIARAFLVQEPAMGRWITRTKKIKAERIPYRVQSVHDLPPRLSGVLAVLFLSTKATWRPVVVLRTPFELDVPISTPKSIDSVTK